MRRPTASLAIVRVKVSDILSKNQNELCCFDEESVKSGLVSRAGFNDNLVKIEEFLKVPSSAFPPITLGVNGVIIDGRHRVWVAMLRGEETIGAVIDPTNGTGMTQECHNGKEA